MMRVSGNWQNKKECKHWRWTCATWKVNWRLSGDNGLSYVISVWTYLIE
jgi:hypothetical protein